MGEGENLGDRAEGSVRGQERGAVAVCDERVRSGLGCKLRGLDCSAGDPLRLQSTGSIPEDAEETRNARIRFMRNRLQVGIYDEFVFGMGPRGSRHRSCDPPGRLGRP